MHASTAFTRAAIVGALVAALSACQQEAPRQTTADSSKSESEQDAEDSGTARSGDAIYQGGDGNY